MGAFQLKTIRFFTLAVPLQFEIAHHTLEMFATWWVHLRQPPTPAEIGGRMLELNEAHRADVAA